MFVQMGCVLHNSKWTIVNGEDLDYADKLPASDVCVGAAAKEYPIPIVQLDGAEHHIQFHKYLREHARVDRCRSSRGKFLPARQ